MKLKISLFLTVLLIFICCIGAASATEDITDDAISVDSDVIVVGQADDGALEVNNDEDVLSSGEEVSTWTDLKNKAENTSDQTINLASGTIDIGSDNIQFANNAVIIGKADSYISGNAAGRIPFTSTSNSALQITFQNVNFRNIQCQMLIQLQTTGTSILNNCTFTNITAGTGHDSVVYNNLGTMNITDCTFSDCTSGYGVVSNYMSRSTTGVTLNVRGSTFENNYASTEPGCINNCGQLYVWASTFNNNRAAWWAGAIHTHTNAKSVIRTSSFNGNTAGWNGGALYTYANLEVYDSNFTDNNCSTNSGGGAIGASNYFWASTDYNVTVNNCRFVDNNNLASSGRGGAIAAMNGGVLTVTGSTFIHNSADIGQAIAGYNTDTYSNISQGEARLVIKNNYFINHTIKTGTTVYLEGTYTFTGNTFINSPQTKYNKNNNYNGVLTLISKSPEILGACFEEEIIGDSEATLSPDEFDSSYVANDNIVITLKAGEYIDVSDSGNWVGKEGKYNITIIGEDREKTLITNVYYGDAYPILWQMSGNKNNNCSVTFINITFKSGSYIELDRMNFNFINCTFEKMPIKIDSQTKNVGDGVETDYQDGFSYTFNNCLFANYTAEDLSYPLEGFNQNSVLEFHKISNAQFTNCIFENIVVDSIFTSYAIKYDAPNGVYASLIVKDCTFNNVVVKGIVKTTEESVSNIITDNKYNFDKVQKTIALEDSVYVDVPVNATTLTVKVADIKEGEDFTIDVTLSNNLTANVSVVINQKEYNVSVVNGTGSLKVSDKLAANTYNVEASYAGEYPYAASNASTSFKVEVIPTSLSVKVADIKEGEDFTIDVTLSNNLTANVSVVINQKEYNVSVVNGTGSLKVSDKLAANTYNVEASFKGLSPYAASTNATTFKVEKVSAPASDKDKQTTTPKVTKKATKITAKKATFKAKKKTKKYTIVLKAGKAAVKKVKVTLKVGKKTYKATTNSKGKATFKITKLNKKGKYNAVIKFAGNKNFKPTSKKVKITVKK